jgi:SAM-dependent methyltransferase
MAKGYLDEGEQARFASVEERDEFYQRPLYGERFNTAAYLRPQREFNQMMFMKAGVRAGEKLYLLGEALETIGLIAMGQAAVAPKGEFVPIEMRPLAFEHKGGRWGVYRELTAPYRDAEFDGAIAAQTHHCDDLIPEISAMVRIVKPGRKVVLVDNGPSRSTFELAKQDVLLGWLLRQFVIWAGSRHVPTGEAFDYQKSIWLSMEPQEIVAAAKTVLDDVRLWEYEGMMIIDGVRPR